MKIDLLKVSTELVKLTLELAVFSRGQQGLLTRRHNSYFVPERDTASLFALSDLIIIRGVTFQARHLDLSGSRPFLDRRGRLHFHLLGTRGTSRLSYFSLDSVL
jgi:hypothetical protein